MLKKINNRKQKLVNIFQFNLLLCDEYEIDQLTGSEKLC